MLKDLRVQEIRVADGGEYKVLNMIIKDSNLYLPVVANKEKVEFLMSVSRSRVPPTGFFNRKIEVFEIDEVGERGKVGGLLDGETRVSLPHGLLLAIINRATIKVAPYLVEFTFDIEEVQTK